MRLGKFTFIFLVLSFFATKIDGFTQSWIKKPVDKLLFNKETRAFSGEVLISQNGKIIYQKAIGIANGKKNLQIKINDNYVLRSNSKQITAILILREVEKGNIDLQKPIKSYLPNHHQKWTDSITANQLLSHTSGIVNLEKPLVAKPSTAFKFTDLNYILLWEIVGSFTNISYEKAVSELFSVCGMKNSGHPNREIQSNMVSGFHVSEEKEEVSKYIIPKDRIPAADLVSTVADLAIWNKKLHEGGL